MSVAIPLKENVKIFTTLLPTDLQVLPQAGIVVANSELGQVDLDNPESALGEEDGQSETQAGIIIASPQDADVGECEDQGQALIAQVWGTCFVDMCWKHLVRMVWAVYCTSIKYKCSINNANDNPL